MPNQMMVIQPYWHADTWVFDDPDRGLEKEPFVAGIPEMISFLCREIEDAEDGFRLLFSGEPFPGHQECAVRMEQEYDGWYYGVEFREEHQQMLDAALALVDAEQLDMVDEIIVEVDGKKVFKGWLCPALFKYFDEAPDRLYVKAEPLKAS